MGVAAVDSSPLHPSSNTVHQRTTGSVTFTGALTSLWLVLRAGCHLDRQPCAAPYLLTRINSLLLHARQAFSERQGDTSILVTKINVLIFYPIISLLLYFAYLWCEGGYFECPVTILTVVDGHFWCFRHHEIALLLRM